MGRDHEQAPYANGAHKIELLPSDLINKIAAGEVVERPASVVKELLENALDAGASDIRIDITEGGKKLIRVRDNGCGMNREDALLAFERHATSKIRKFADLERIASLGFRGEALPSIASVSDIHLTTSDGSRPEGTEIYLKDGTVKEIRAAGRGKGTTIEVQDLFLNIPARKKFLKSNSTELSHITGTVSETALAHPDVYFTLRHNGRTLIQAPDVDSILERAGHLFGRDLKANLTEVEEGVEGMHLFGFVSIPGYSRPNGRALNFFVNRRPVSDPTLRHAVYEAYETLLMKGRHPVVYLFLEINPSFVDVNVHPTKREVRFADIRRIHNFVREAVRKTVQDFGRQPGGAQPDDPGPSGREERVREAVASYFKQAGHPPLHVQAAQTGESRRNRVSGTNFASLHPAARPTCTSSTPAVQSLFSERLVPMGQIDNSFIITQDREGLLLVDQHAAHERILYEKFMKQYERQKIPVQRLLIPVNLSLSQREELLLQEYTGLLGRLGLEIDDLGHGTFAIKGVPVWVSETDIAELVRAIIEEIGTLGKAEELERQIGKVIHLFSCRGAIKAHQPLQMEEMESLLKDLSRTESPHTCEHGRPTMIRIDLPEILRRFKRT